MSSREYPVFHFQQCWLFTFDRSFESNSKVGGFSEFLHWCDLFVTFYKFNTDQTSTYWHQQMHAPRYASYHQLQKKRSVTTSDHQRAVLMSSSSHAHTETCSSCIHTEHAFTNEEPLSHLIQQRTTKYCCIFPYILFSLTRHRCHRPDALAPITVETCSVFVWSSKYSQSRLRVATQRAGRLVLQPILKRLVRHIGNMPTSFVSFSSYKLPTQAVLQAYTIPV